ncbi:4-hydroxybenzoate octaprenyl transferase [marine gamma proteobacterium HTCC2207]|jgi:4-hydroxybenzoate polyprenyltransferase|uniref:4-hydroxybenzoate octaprenyltransferase n=1 Tax=gamma proteobacterium HTCC2207 TaxID=314287 RepID=Q1YV47_9GAMM|nr:4-hydroxybenzoate octaprenyl transferase [marine gamma proteobacterium HTCC2207] [gamma proteobacterium HTCC2207]MBT5106371.1 4-hydroxybenzoate octaprenyltransferase [Porticoccaceae bacterium]MBT6116122.1 4-hydroxybenzoate octaprenyltransferase [Porticoccaceae bacterium]MBT6592651.1 4-hydroxybenzoate octaprenyltransferase [Porticoccaceae bacterium]MDG1078803.1 4-hydroxybenzoate octaprenyltransferase [Porticoccaceae bacterium]
MTNPATAHPWLRLTRLDKPIGTYLLLWPTLWALWFASGGQPRIENLLIFVLGVVVMRAAGCVINDYADRHVDGEVERTRYRPLPSGEIRAGTALALFFVLLGVALILVLMTNQLTIMLAFGGAAATTLYPFLKRITHWPQLGLGIAWAWSTPMAFAAHNSQLPPQLWVVFVAIVLWTIAFDTYYAMVDREDDLRIGIKSTAILFGRYDLLIVGLLQFAVVLLMATAGILFDRGLIYFVGLAVAAGYFVNQHLVSRGRNRDACFKAFLNNHRVGMIIFIGLASDYLLNP